MLLAATFLAGSSGATIAQTGGGAPELPRKVGTQITPDAKTGEVVKQREATLAGLTPVTEAMLRNPPPGEWIQWLRTYDQHGFSPLTQIKIGRAHV